MVLYTCKYVVVPVVCSSEGAARGARAARAAAARAASAARAAAARAAAAARVSRG